MEKITTLSNDFAREVYNYAMLKDIASKIQKIRKERFKSQKLFAEHIGMSYSNYAKFERTGHTSLENFFKILQALEIYGEFEKLLKTKDLFTQNEQQKQVVVKEDKKEVSREVVDLDLEIKRVVSFFDQERRKIQPNFVRQEFRNGDGVYILKLHLKETGRTPAMFYDAIRWLFSSHPKAAFHRQYIMNIGKLIEHFNTLEHQALYSKESLKLSQEAQSWYNVYKKQGLSDEAILEKLREGGYIS